MRTHVPIRLEGRFFCASQFAAKITVTLAASALALWFFDGFEFFSASDLRLGAILFALAPIASVWVAFSLFLSLNASLGAALILQILLSVVSARKIALTGVPLAWSDLSNVQSFGVALTYVSAWECAILILGAISIAAILARSFSVPCLRSAAQKLFLLTLLLVISLHPYLWILSPKYSYAGEGVLSDLGVVYLPYDWPTNVKRNGLPLHLVQTSQRPLPSSATEENRLEYERLGVRAGGSIAASNVFFILCESCWSDKENFANLVVPLDAAGLLAIRGVSPVYGGGTVNATFEMLTALPARGALNGIIYQEYEQLFSASVDSLPAFMESRGFHSYALHNFDGSFWAREKVYKKFGFRRFISIKDMGYSGPVFYPRDKVMYDFVLEELKKRPKGNFFSLETVYMHGPYQKDGGLGDSDYASRLALTMQDLSNFVRAIKSIDPSAVILVYGDHKPALTRFFLKKKVLPMETFSRTGKREQDFRFSSALDLALVGDVPVWVDVPGVEPEALKRTLDGMPFYCISALLATRYLGGGSPASKYAEENVCRSYSARRYAEAAKQVPSWLYYLALFDR